LERLDDTLARIGRFRDERAAKAIRLQEVRDGLGGADPTGPWAGRAEPTEDDQRDTGAAHP
jgi:hypothetical protein